MPTPHNNAKPGDIAKTVLMPGDPLRAEFIANTYLENPVCYNSVRGMLGFTGTYNGKTISVQGSGMGMPSIGIYSHELYTEYGVENIIRVGTAGSISDEVNLRDIVIGMGSCTNSNYAVQYGLPGTFAPIASYKLLKSAAEASVDQDAVFHVGNILSSDTFYDDSESLAMWKKMNVHAKSIYYLDELLYLLLLIFYLFFRHVKLLFESYIFSPIHISDL